MPYNFASDSFTQINFVADFFKRSAILEEKRPFSFLSSLLGDLGTTYDDHLRLIGKHVEDFLLVLIELFFARYYG